MLYFTSAIIMATQIEVVRKTTSLVCYDSWAISVNFHVDSMMSPKGRAL